MIFKGGYMNKLEKIKRYIQIYGINNFLRHFMKILTNLSALSNWRCRNLVINESDYKYLKKKYGYIVKEFSKENVFSEEIEKKFWTCWLQGEENAPEIVYSCWESFKKYFPDYEFNIITKDNLNEYVQFPDYIEEKFAKGIFGPAHYTDLLRIELLDHYGGIWVDSTVFCTGREFIDMLYLRKSHIFVFKNCLSLDPTTAISSWFICAQQNSNYLKCLKKMLYEYWKNENTLCNYFLFHMFFMLIAECWVDDWKEIPTFSNIPPHIMQQELFDEYSEKRFKELCSISNIHKLTYKLSQYNKDKTNTIYKNILQK